MPTKPQLILLFIASQSLCVTAIFAPNHVNSLKIQKTNVRVRPFRRRCTAQSQSCLMSSSIHRRHQYRHQHIMDGLINNQNQCHGSPSPSSGSLAFLHHATTRTANHPIKRIPLPIMRQPQSASFTRNRHHNSPNKNTNTQLSMSLIPIPINELQSILPTPYKLTPNGDQYTSYLGRTPKQRFNSLFEGVSIAFLGSMFAYFISFVIGQFLATLLGVVFLFWPILSPEFKAYQRNWELVGGRDLVDVWMDYDDDDDGGWRDIPEDKRGLYGAYYVTRIEDACVVDDVRASSDEEYDLEEFSGYTMATDELESVTGIPWKLRLRLSDDEGRGMQVHSRLSEEYLDIEPGMNAVGVLLSTSKEFGGLAGMTDFCVLDEANGDAVAWVGDYPYLDKDMFLRTLDENGVAGSMLDFEEEGEGDDEEMYDSGEEEEAEEEYVNVL